MNRKLTHTSLILLIHWACIATLGVILYVSVSKHHQTEVLLRTQIKDNKSLAFMVEKATKDIERASKYLKHCQNNVDTLVVLCTAAIEEKEEQLKACNAKP